MMKLLLKFFALAISLTIMFSPTAALAWDPFAGANCDEALKAAACAPKDTGNPIAGSNSLLLKITNIVAFAGGIAAVIMLLVGSIRYITANGDSKNTTTAKDTIIYALIGIVVIISGKLLITFVLSKL